MKKRSSLLVVICLALCTTSFAQLKKEVVHISFKVVKKTNNTYDLIADVTVAPKWHVYSLNAGDGPVSTSLAIQSPFKGKWVDEIGKPTEKGKKISKYEEVFKSNVHYFENKVQFVLPIKKKSAFKGCVPVSLEYMVCNDKECLPPTQKTDCVVLN